MGKTGLNEAERKFVAQARDRLQQEGEGADPAAHLRNIAVGLVSIHCRNQVLGFRTRMRNQIEQWLVDEGDSTPDRLEYWYDVLLNKSGEDEFLDVALEVWSAIDRAAVQSILQSCDRLTERYAESAPLSA